MSNPFYNACPMVSDCCLVDGNVDQPFFNFWNIRNATDEFVAGHVAEGCV